MPFAEIDDAKINYEISGKGEPLLLISGIAGDINFFRSLIPILNGRYMTIVYDQRGVGKTEYKGEFTCQTLVDDAKALLNHLGIKKTHLLGWSMGSQVAMEYSLKYPETVQTLTLISAFKYAPARSIYMMNMIVNLCIEYNLPSEFIIETMNLFSLTEGYFKTKREKAEKMKRINNSTPDKIRQQLRCLEKYDLRGRLSVLSMPVLSVHGLDDIMVDPSLGDDIVSDVPQAEVLRIPNIGHIIHSSLYCDKLLDFLAKYPFQS